MATFKPLHYSPGIIKKYKVKRLGPGKASHLLSYNSATGLYTLGDDLIRLEAQRRYGVGAKSYHVREIVDAVRLNAEIIGPDMINNPKNGILIFRNGVLGMGNLRDGTDLNKVALCKFSPNWLYTIGIPHRFEPGAECHNFDRFVSQILPDECHPLLRQILGYLLVPSTNFRKFFIFVGAGANGKSTLIEVIVRMLGRDNVSHQSLHQLAESRFASAELHGKLCNSYADLDSGDVRSTGLLKQIVAGDSMQFEKKFRDPFSAPVTARLLFSANKIPIIKEESEAIQDRLIIVEFPRRFEEGQQDRNLIGRLTTEAEIEGIIVRWAVPGLASLLKSGRFDIPTRSEELQNDYRKQSDPFRDFADQRIEEITGSLVSKSEVYQNYQNWCTDQGIALNQQMSQEEFNKRVEEAYKIPDDDFRMPRSRIRAWKGIRLKQGEESQDDPRAIPG
jgi:putative DNA primase/helicase